MPGTPLVAGPAYITNSAANISGVNPSANTYHLVRHVHLVNTDSSARTVTLYKGATGGSAGGTEILKSKSIAATDVYDMYWPAGDKYTTTDFMSGLASVTNVVTIEVTGEKYAA
jgi:hypothetical protein